ncbi:hypothetical protein BSSX_0570 [Bacillus subtilis]|nr:hypothetical protein BSSX_0570 [Bacillus subtilis]
MEVEYQTFNNNMIEFLMSITFLKKQIEQKQHQNNRGKVN